MADNITLPGLGTDVATDDVGGKHYQRLKVDVGADGSAAPLVDEAVPTVLLPTSSKVVRLSQTPTVSTSPAYSSADAVGGLLTFANAARASGGSIVIDAISIVDNAGVMSNMDLVLFDRTFTASTDNAAFAPSDADLLNVIAVLSFTAWNTFSSSNKMASRTAIGLSCKLNGTSLFGQLVSRSTVTLAATNDITVILHVTQN